MARVRWYLPPFLLAISPLVIVVGANLGTVPLRAAVIARALLFVAALTAVVLLALRVVQRDFAARAAWLSWFLILFNLYAASAQGLRFFNLQIFAPDPLFAVPYVVTSGVIAASLFLLVGMVPAAEEERQTEASWGPTAEQLIESALSQPTTPGFAAARDIYYVVLDSLGSADTLRRSYNVDLSPFVAALNARGFYVVEGARSNYAQTYPSLASTLNMGYLDEIVDSFDALESYGGGVRRTFVFAHILAPHPPFVFARDGTPRQPPRRPYTLADSRPGSGPRPEDVDGYGQQSEYVLARMIEVVDALLRRPGPPPAIVVHGDHGPGRGLLHGRSNNDLGIRERMEIFAAYYFPDGNAGLYSTMTPVNGARLLARGYLGAELPLLPDRVLFSPLERPYDFMPVPDAPAQDSFSPVRIR